MDIFVVEYKSSQYKVGKRKVKAIFTTAPYPKRKIEAFSKT